MMAPRFCSLDRWALLPQSQKKTSDRLQRQGNTALLATKNSLFLVEAEEECQPSRTFKSLRLRRKRIRRIFQIRGGRE